MSTPAVNTLQALSFPLHGSRLIEASAGTGKTWTIAALYLRLVLGHGEEAGFGRALLPSEILVMTFTRAATRELSDRIRARLLEAARVFRAEAQPRAEDGLLADLLAAYPDGPARSQAAHRLALAAEGMDDAAIHTIDAWCQRMLREHAFDSGSLFDEELLPDEAHLLTQAAQDYWRQQCYPLQPEELQTVLAVWPGVEELTADIRNLLPYIEPAAPGDWDRPEGHLRSVLTRVAQARRAQLAQLKQGWVEKAQRLGDWIGAQTAPKTCPWDRRKLAGATVNRWLSALADWAQDPDADTLPLTDTACQRLQPSGMAEVWKGTGAMPPLPPEFAAFAQLLAGLAQLPSVAEPLRRHASASVARRLDELKRQSGHFSFADLLLRLDAALCSPSGARLRERILSQTPVALIDEFQDTSALQYRIFDRLYPVEESARESARESERESAEARTRSALLLIGDPKQSIYRFRGADIASYLSARQATAGRHYVLGTNHRSTQALVAAVNHCFAQAEQRPGAGAFGYREAGANPLLFVSVAAQGRAEQLLSAGQPMPALTLVHDLNAASKDYHLQAFAERCAEHIVCWLNDAQTGFAAPSAPLRRLRPADVAVLVRTGTEAKAVRRALARRRVASVYLSDRDSVFLSDEAADLLYLLRAIAQPLDTRLARAALATRTLGLSLAELAWLAASDEAFDARAEQLRQLHRIWQTQGVLPLLRQTLHLFALPARWLQPESAATDGERRLTNFLHLAELLQTASRELDGEQALIRWLSEQCEAAAQAQASSDEQVLRLESDADLVKVITIHKSKGLEYPLVCLPFATSFRAEGRGTRAFSWVDETGQRQLALELDEALLARAERERLREDLRLLYVALTRARHALWLGFAALTVGNSPACQTHLSAAGHLLAGPQAQTPEALYQSLQTLAQGCEHIQLRAAPPEPPGVTWLTARAEAAALAEAPTYAGEFDRHWGIASFSALVRAMAPTASRLTPTQSLRPADDEQAPEPSAAPAAEFAPEAAPDTTPETAADAAPATDPAALQVARPAVLATPAVPGAPGAAPWHHFERGPLAGNFLHEQLEWLATEGFALGEDERLAQRLRRRCERAGRGAQADDVLTWLTAVVNAPLPGPGASLAQLERVLPEMEFWLPAQRLPAQDIDALCRAHLLPDAPAHPPRPTLPQRELHGLLMGFADLVVQHAGRFWVLDYKSNQLGSTASAYSTPALAAAMAAHRYDVQAALYLLALHRLLRQRLGEAYQPEQHLGGALYLFLRGVDGPAGGVYTVAPDWVLLDALDELLAQEAAA